MNFAHLISLPCMFLFSSCNATAFDYTRLIHLDAELLCEEGMQIGYASVIPALKQYAVPQPLTEVEIEDSDDYTISIDGIQYPVYVHGKHNAADCAKNATNIFFHIINKQITNTDYKFYAFYKGHDLHGAFLNKYDLQEITSQNPNKYNEMPYLPNKPTHFNVIEIEE